MSKVRKQSRGQLQATELFADDDFDTEEFVEQMDHRDRQQRPEGRSGWRRLEQLREEQQLRAQLLDLEDWHDFDKV